LIEQCLTFPPTQYKLSGRQFYGSKDPTNSIKVLKKRRYKSKTRSQAVARIADRTAKTCSGHVT